MSISVQAFVLRLKPGHVDRLDEAMKNNQLIIGWSEADGLLDPSLTRGEFTEIIRKAYEKIDEAYRKKPRLYNAVGQMWRFIREMRPGDFVLSPRDDDVFIARVNGPVKYYAQHRESDTAHRRPAKWLNMDAPVSRSELEPKLRKRLRAGGTSVRATDLLPQIEKLIAKLR